MSPERRKAAAADLVDVCQRIGMSAADTLVLSVAGAEEDQFPTKESYFDFCQSIEDGIADVIRSEMAKIGLVNPTTIDALANLATDAFTDRIEDLSLRSVGMGAA